MLQYPTCGSIFKKMQKMMIFSKKIVVFAANFLSKK